MGDFGNVTADKDGKAHLDYTDPLISFEGRDSIIGRGLIVHAMADDLVSQPAGNAGPRVAAGWSGSRQSDIGTPSLSAGSLVRFPARPGSWPFRRSR